MEYEENLYRNLPGSLKNGDKLKELSSTPIAQGRTAEIFPWNDRNILKLYRDWCPPDWVEYEARIARAVFEAGVPSPAAGEIVEINGRRGLIYERLEGISMPQDMNAPMEVNETCALAR